MITVLVVIGYGIFCFLLGYVLAFNHYIDQIERYQKAEKLHEQLHEVDNELIEKGSQHG